MLVALIVLSFVLVLLLGGNAGQLAYSLAIANHQTRWAALKVAGASAGVAISIGVGVLAIVWAIRNGA